MIRKYGRLILLPMLVPGVGLMGGCNPCANPGAATACVTACATATNPRVACNSCCNAKVLTPAGRNACKDGCNAAYPTNVMIPGPQFVDSVPDDSVSEVVQNTEDPPPPEFSPCSCEYLTPCDSSVTDPVFAELPSFWRSSTFANFICSLTEDERADLLKVVQDSQELVLSYSQEAFNEYMGLLDAKILDIMEKNGVEGHAQYTFYANNLLYGLLGGELGIL